MGMMLALTSGFRSSNSCSRAACSENANQCHVRSDSFQSPRQFEPILFNWDCDLLRTRHNGEI
jgi:hypothetical protein